MKSYSQDVRRTFEIHKESKMPTPNIETRYRRNRGKRASGPGCQIYDQPATGLGRFFDICSGLLRQGQDFWFRGHTNIKWRLTPSALRFETVEERDKALDLLSDFKRLGEIKLTNPPSPDEELKWVQLARHYGLPTRLLDWTKNAAIALYFACLKAPDGDDDEQDRDGGVFILNPVDLNRDVDPKNPRVFDAHSDAKTINRYLNLKGERNARGPKTIALNPVWNSERIVLQQGVFTLHGSRDFTLTGKQVPSLVCLRVPSPNKQDLLYELERVGINEMAIFPEVEHMCRYLIWREKLYSIGGD